MTTVATIRETGLIRLVGKERVLKSGPRIKLLSAIDEAASALGLAHTYSSDARLREILLRIQCDLSLLMTDVATPSHRRDTVGMTITPGLVRWLEEMKAAILAKLDLPDLCLLLRDSLEGAALAVAGTVIRRAERLEMRLVQQHLATNPDVLRYLKRLSEMIFTLACAALVRQEGSIPARLAKSSAEKGVSCQTGTESKIHRDTKNEIACKSARSAI